jgi:RHS repeat-associated protein
MGLTGRQHDPPGLYYYRARYYHPSFCRFISQDPAGFAAGDTNLYVYVYNSPTNYTDPTGEVALWAAGCAIGAAAFAGYYLLTERKPTLGGTLSRAGAGCSLGRTLGGLGGAAYGEHISRAIPRGGAKPVRLGQAGERLVRQKYDIGRKVPIKIGDQTRIPDGLTRTTISEVKNVGSLSYTRQLQDYVQYARDTGRTFDLCVRRNTTLSRTLEDLSTPPFINVIRALP